MVCLPGSGGADTPESVFLQEIGGRNFAEIWSSPYNGVKSKNKKST